MRLCVNNPIKKPSNQVPVGLKLAIENLGAKLACVVVFETGRGSGGRENGSSCSPPPRLRFSPATQSM